MDKLPGFFSALLLVAVLWSCNSGAQKSEKIDDEVYKWHQNTGEKISSQTQGVLLANVGKAIQEGGAAYAVEFCNLKASSIADSLSRANNCTISRVSAKNRNPQNALQTKPDKELWEYFVSASPEITKDTVVLHDGHMIYYKPIRMGMPACLLCHGTPGGDIEPATAEKIRQHYPDDLATGYRMNDFRGMWKIEFVAGGE
jgi:hypothetical protein